MGRKDDMLSIYEIIMWKLVNCKAFLFNRLGNNLIEIEIKL